MNKQAGLDDAELFTLRARELIAEKLREKGETVLICTRGFIDSVTNIPISDATAVCLLREDGFNLAEVLTGAQSDQVTDADKVAAITELVGRGDGIEACVKCRPLCEELRNFLKRLIRVMGSKTKAEILQALTD